MIVPPLPIPLHSSMPAPATAHPHSLHESERSFRSGIEALASVTATHYSVTWRHCRGSATQKCRTRKLEHSFRGAPDDWFFPQDAVGLVGGVGLPRTACCTARDCIGA